jgi:hypothetical protein
LRQSAFRERSFAGSLDGGRAMYNMINAGSMLLQPLYTSGSILLIDMRDIVFQSKVNILLCDGKHIEGP